jgi:hypothetical protein
MMIQNARRAAVFLVLIGLLAIAMASLSSCAMVKQKDREYLADPIMQRVPDPQGARMESHNLPRREGSAGGSAGSGGGCGC